MQIIAEPAKTAWDKGQSTEPGEPMAAGIPAGGVEDDTNLISLCHKKHLPAKFKGHILVTDNAKHFELLRPLGLVVENPLA